MSTELKEIKTITKDYPNGKTVDVESFIYSTVFAGRGGRNLQLTVTGVDSAVSGSYIHLTVDDAIELRKRLTQFIEREY